MADPIYPYQETAAQWLAGRQTALLADGPRVGKTAAVIRAADYTFADNVLEITTGSARMDHARAWKRFQMNDRRVTPIFEGDQAIPREGVVVTSFKLATGPLFDALMERRFDTVWVDEEHRAKTPGIPLTNAIYGPKNDRLGGLTSRSEWVWTTSGTPAPNHQGELWTVLRALYPESIMSTAGRPYFYEQFEKRYVETRQTAYGTQVVGAKRVEELRDKIAPFMLRRTLAEVRPDLPPLRFEMLNLDPGRAIGELRRFGEAQSIQPLREALDALDDGDSARWDTLDFGDTHLATLRRLTGRAKVAPMAEWAREAIEDCGGKLVLFAQHTDVIEALADRLKKFRPLVLAGGMPGRERQALQDAFREDPDRPLFIGQNQAAGEAIDLSAADDAVAVEPPWVPGDNEQLSHRIVNTEKMRPTLFRFAALAGSLDERIQQAVRRKTAALSRMFG